MIKYVMLVLAVAAGTAVAQPAPASAPAPAAAHSPAELRAICTQAMNADPSFAKSIVATVDKQIDQQTLAAHQDAYKRIQVNDRHVFIAYAAMWVIAAAFVVFLWFRQRALTAEIAQLRRELEAAAKEGT